MPVMRVETRRAGPADYGTELLVWPVFEDEGLGHLGEEIDRIAGGGLSRVIDRGDFRGRKDDASLIYPHAADAPCQRILLVGLGARDKFNAEQLRKSIGTAVRHAERLRVTEFGLAAERVEAASRALAAAGKASGASGDGAGASGAGAGASGNGAGASGGVVNAVALVAEAATLAAWQFRELKTVTDPDQPAMSVDLLTLFAADEAQEARCKEGERWGATVGRASNLARDLASRPGNIATPSHLAETAQAIADQHGLEVTVLDREALEREGMHGLLAVAQGSHEEPRFIALEYRGASDDVKPLVLVGKGVTFDSGGISIKPAAKMEEMKYDMSGAAAVLGAMQGIAELGMKANVIGLVPSTENLPSGTAVKPGDVIGSHLGKSVEVINTDAEGRLILIDALSYAGRYEPAAVVDCATLTGSVVIGLGHHAIGLMGNDEDLIAEVRAAGGRAGERCWPLPLWDEYREQLDSDVADIKNTGGRPAGSITAGWFLREFVGDFPWAHLDIAGTAYRDENPPYLRKGPTGAPTRLFIEWVRHRAHS